MGWYGVETAGWYGVETRIVMSLHTKKIRVDVNTVGQSMVKISSLPLISFLRLLILTPNIKAGSKLERQLYQIRRNLDLAAARGDSRWKGCGQCFWRGCGIVSL